MHVCHQCKVSIIFETIEISVDTVAFWALKIRNNRPTIHTGHKENARNQALLLCWALNIYTRIASIDYIAGMLEKNKGLSVLYRIRQEMNVLAP